MRAFAKKQNQPQRPASVDLTRREKGTASQSSREAPLAPHSHGLGHDFSRTPMHSKASARLLAKLELNAPGDIYEQEADRVSEHVMSAPPGSTLRSSGCGDGGCSTLWNGTTLQGQLRTKRLEAADREEVVAPPIVREVLHSSGQPLEPTVRKFMELRFGQDFSQVRVHTDANAADAASALESRAFTLDRDIVFGANEYAPASTESRHLLAHELTHVVQQSRMFTDGSRVSQIQRAPDRESKSTGATEGAASLPQKINFWMNSFIPKTVPGAQQVPKGTYAGKTMFKGPLPTSDCFLSDSRLFSNAIDAPTRIHAQVEVDLSARTFHFQKPTTSGTAEVDCEDGDVECEKMADISFESNTGREFQASFAAWGSDPCITGAPDIDMNGILFVYPVLGVMVFTGLVEPFPAFEAYASVDGQAPQTVFQQAISYPSPWALPGKANTPVIGHVKFPKMPAGEPKNPAKHDQADSERFGGGFGGGHSGGAGSGGQW